MGQRKLRAVSIALLALAAGALPALAGGPPFHADLAGGKTLPLPWGIGLTYYTQSQDYAIDRLALGIPGFENVPVDLIDIENEIDAPTLKFDVWLLPFLDLVALVGQIDGDTDVDFRALQLPIPLQQVTIDYDGDLYGGGITLAGGGDVWFVSGTAIYTETNLSGDFDSEISSGVVMPRVGLYNERGSVWIGGMYLQTDESHSGTVQLPFLGPVPFEVELEQEDDWNALAGVQGTFGRHWTVELEAGFGARESISASAGYRF